MKNHVEIWIYIVLKIWVFFFLVGEGNDQVRMVRFPIHEQIIRGLLIIYRNILPLSTLFYSIFNVGVIKAYFLIV